MDTVTIVRRLWRHRILVVLALLLAILAGALVSYKLPSLESRKYQVGVGSARILVDTPASQVVDLAPKGSESLGPRTNLLASLMVDGEIKAEIAKAAGLGPEDLIGVNQDASEPSAVAQVPDRNSHVLATKVTTITNGAWLPIIEVETQAPTKEQAQRLASAALSSLQSYLDSRAAADAVKDADRLKISGLSAAQARTVTRGPRLLFSLAAAIFTFIAGCALILGVSGLVTALRAPQPTVAAGRSDGARESAGTDPHPDQRTAGSVEPAEPDVDLQVTALDAHRKARNGHRPNTAPPPEPAPTPDDSSSWWGGAR